MHGLQHLPTWFTFLTCAAIAAAPSLQAQGPHPAPGERSSPQLVFDPPIEQGLEVTVPSGTSTTATFTVVNGGDSSAEFQFPHFQNDRGLGGPDAFGYSWIDSHEPHGPTFEPIDIRDTGLEITPLLPSPGCDYSAPDEGYQVVDLPFSFPFYGEYLEQVWVSANGFLTFDPQVFQVQCSFAIHEIPSTSRPNFFIAPLWADLHGYTQGRIYVEHLDDGRFVVQWTDWARFNQQGQFNTFQAMLHPSGLITYQYLELEGSFGAATRVGIENQDGTIGLQVASGGAYMEVGLAVRITPAPVFVTAVSPASGSLGPGASIDVAVTFDATSLLEGLYGGHLRIGTTQNGGNEEYDYPVTLHVEGEAGCHVEPDLLIFPETIVGDSRSRELGVVNLGTASCTLTQATTSSDDFGVDFGEAVVLSPGDSTSFDVTFAPTMAGSLGATLTFATDAGDLTASLQGTGLAPPEPTIDPHELEFSLPAEGTAEQVVVLTNQAAKGGASLDFSVSLLVRGTPAPKTAPAARARQPEPREALRGQPASAGAPLPQRAPPRAGSHGDELIQDGSFEAGTPNPYWDEGSLAFGSPICSHAIGCNPNVGSGPRTGDWWVWLGGHWDFEAAFVSQTVIIPTGHAQLSFWLEMPVAGTAGFMRVRVDENVVFEVTGADAPQYPVYQQVLLDLSEYADGGERVVRFEAQLEAGSFFIDDVSLTAWVPIISVLPRGGTVAPGGTAELLFTADTEQVEPGLYEFEALILTNAPQSPELTLPITVTVFPVDTEADATAPRFVLEQNYPNPLALTTTIAYSLARSTRVRLAVYDATGRRVTTLVDGEVPAGRHTATWTASGLASGVYFYRLEARSYTKTLRALVVR